MDNQDSEVVHSIISLCIQHGRDQAWLQLLKTVLLECPNADLLHTVLTDMGYRKDT